MDYDITQNDARGVSEQDKPEPPHCNGKNVGDEQICDGIVWRWMDTYWQQII